MIEYGRFLLLFLAPLCAQGFQLPPGWVFFPSCHICGAEVPLSEKSMKNEDAVISSLGLSCRIAYWGARAGFINCEKYYSEVGEVCGCEQQPTPTQQPTSSPTQIPTMQPTPLPTADNEVYANAQTLTTGGASLVDLITEETMSEQQFVVTCSQKNEFMLTRGMWYKYFARSSGFVTVANCGTYQGTIDVYQPLQLSSSDDVIPTFSCVPGEIKNRETCDSVSWVAERGQEYAILVSGSDPENISQIDPTFSVVVADNHQCEFSIGPINIDTTIPVTRKATTTPLLAPECLDLQLDGLDIYSYAVWYKIEGTGSLVKVSTCSSNTGGIIISIFSGSSCTDLICVEESSSTLCDVTFSSSLDETYYILLRGEYEDENFDLVISSAGDGPENISCDAAEEFSSRAGMIPFSKGFSSSATTTDLPPCASETAYDHHLWFKYTDVEVGDANLLALSISSSDLLDFPLDYIQVFSSSSGCDQLTCVPNIGYFVSCTSRCTLIMDFPAPPEGLDYYILLSTDYYYTNLSAEDEPILDLEFGLQYELLSI